MDFRVVRFQWRFTPQRLYNRLDHPFYESKIPAAGYAQHQFFIRQIVLPGQINFRRFKKFDLGI